MKSFAKRFPGGSDLYLGVEEMVERYGIAAGAVLSAAGNFSQVQFGLTGEDSIASIGHFELALLTGTAALDAILLELEVIDGKGVTHAGRLRTGCIVADYFDLVITAASLADA